MPICKFCGEEFELSDARMSIPGHFPSPVEYSAVAEPPNLMK
ncbi:hypothetical protein [Sellimonas catena]|nr:hypothetical protein [Sellimonas catena]